MVTKMQADKRKEAMQHFIDDIRKGRNFEESFTMVAQETLNTIRRSFMPYAHKDVLFIIIALTMLEKDFRLRYPEEANLADEFVENCMLISAISKVRKDEA